MTSESNYNNKKPTRKGVKGTQFNQIEFDSTTFSNGERI
jgi:hypothetical protein